VSESGCMPVPSRVESRRPQTATQCVQDEAGVRQHL